MSQIAFISLGCAKNLVNTEQMMALVNAEGHDLVSYPEEADVVVINTCGFIDSAKEEAINTILEVAQCKEGNPNLKILVTGCLPQRYPQEILEQLPEVDGILGTGSFSSICQAIEEVLAEKKPCLLGDISAPVEELPRIITTPSYYAYLRIAEGCDNHCCFCIIPKLRGKYRSRKMEDILEEAKELSESGVKELLVIAQDITRYGTDNYGKPMLSTLIHELCKLDFHWIRLHYTYPELIDDELIETIASEEKVVKYLDIPIQHCNDRILKAMNRRGDKAYLLNMFQRLRKRIPNIVIRTSLITGLPYEGEEEFNELCDFLKEVKIERAGVFPYYPEEGTPGEKMLNRVSFEEASRRAELVQDLQSRIMDDYNEEHLGQVIEVLCEGWSEESQSYQGRTYADSPGIDGTVYFQGREGIEVGTFVPVRITGVMDGDLTGEEETMA